MRWSYEMNTNWNPGAKRKFCRNVAQSIWLNLCNIWKRHGNTRRSREALVKFGKHFQKMLWSEKLTFNFGLPALDLLGSNINPIKGRLYIVWGWSDLKISGPSRYPSRSPASLVPARPVPHIRARKARPCNFCKSLLSLKNHICKLQNIRTAILLKIQNSAR